MSHPKGQAPNQAICSRRCGWRTYLQMRTPEGSVILRVTPTDTTLPRGMLKVSQSFFSLLQKNVLDRQRWPTRADLRLAIVTWIEKTYHRKRRQRRLGRLTPIEFETINTGLKAA
jgi:transposase InsO family protein